MARRTVAEHAAVVRALLPPGLLTATEPLPLAAALGRCTAGEVLSPVDLPLFRNSQMDGYAVRAADVAAAPVTLPVVAAVPAGPGEPLALPPGAAIKIMTGAVVPDGADAIVPVEDTTASDGTVAIARGRGSGEFVRERGSDLPAGAALVAAGTRLRSRHLAALAAAGVAEVTVRRALRVAVLTTGAELVTPGEPLGAGQIFDANGPALAAAVVEEGGLLTSLERVDDDAPRFAAALERALAGADLVLTSGGISQGDYEVVRQVLGPRGADVVEIAMQPGGPQSTAVIDGVGVVSLPGNPVSTQVSFAIFVRPLLREAAGLAPVPTLRAPAAEGFASVPGKRQYRRGRLDDNGRVHLVAGPGSHLVAAMAAADVLVAVPEDATTIAAGEELEVIPL